MATNVSAHFTLHRYFLSASRNKSLFETELTAGRADAPHAFIHLQLWYACLFVVLEGWEAEVIVDPDVDLYRSDEAKVRLLRRCRNAVFHYAPDYIDPRLQAVFAEPDFVEWVRAIHDAAGAYFLRV